MKKFFTKYDVYPFSGCTMNPYDAVDRLSYMDTTQQIVSMLRAGARLRLRDNDGFKGEDFNAPSMPVYTPDIAVAQRMLNSLSDELKANAQVKTAEFEASKKEAVNVDNVTPPGDD